MKKKNLFWFYSLLAVLLSVGVAFAADWKFVAEYDATTALSTDATDLQKAEAFSKKFKADDSGITSLMIVPTVVGNADGTVTHVNKPNGTTKVDAKINIYGWALDTNNATATASGIDTSLQKNWSGAVVGTNTYPATGKVITVGSADAPVYGWVGISHPSLSGAGSAIGLRIQIYKKDS